MFGIGVSELVMMVFIGLFVVIPFWKIFSKAGYSIGLALHKLCLFLILLCFFM